MKKKKEINQDLEEVVDVPLPDKVLIKLKKQQDRINKKLKKRQQESYEN